MNSVRFPAFMSILLTGCGAFSTKNTGEQISGNDTTLAGKWGQKACLPSAWLGLGHEQETLTFGALGDFDRTTTIYTDAGCASPAATLALHGTFATLDNAAGVANARNINFTVVSAVVTPNSGAAVKLMNAAAYCGISNWQANGAADVTGKPCLGKTFLNGDVVFDIYQLSNNSTHLELGRKDLWLDSTAAATRPDALDDKDGFDRE